MADFEFLLSPVFLWLALTAFFIILEIITVGLTSIWFAGGALTAFILAVAGVPMLLQGAAFFAVSFILLFFTKPFVLKYVKPHNIRTNYEDIIGKNVRVTALIDNQAGTGTAEFNGLEWTARSVDDNIVIEAGEIACVDEIKGVKLYVRRIQEPGRDTGGQPMKARLEKK